VKYTETRVRFGAAPDPSDLKPGDFWLMEEEDGSVVAVDFLCPCGCGAECYTPVVPKDQPRNRQTWEYEPGPTLTPSIQFTGGCRSHFNITNGEAVMHQ